MSMYAQMSGNKVINVVMGNVEWLSRQPNPEEYIEYTLENPASVNGDYVDGIFYSVQTQPSWVRDGKGGWIPPIPYPEDGDIYTWDEETVSWVVFNV